MAAELDEVWDTELHSGDPLGTPGYADRLAELPHESVRTGRTVTHVVVEGCFDVLGGSMGVVHGERVVRAFDRARELGLPVVCHTRSGGARMQEGMVSLVQMGRAAAAVRRHGEAGLLSVAVLRSPTTGGVLASYASRCDVRVAEAGAVIGFAGPRVVTQVTGETVDGRSHTAETALAAGLIDAVVPAEELDAWVAVALGRQDRPLAPRSLPVAPADPPPHSNFGPKSPSEVDFGPKFGQEAGPVDGPGSARRVVSGSTADADADTPTELGGDADSATSAGAWAEVVAARRPDRPTGIDVAARLCSSWSELGGTDPTVRTALARIGTTPVVVVASDRHAGTGRIGVAGFGQARRAVALAGRLGRPLVTLVDTPGAEPGPDSENAGIAGEIAATFAALDGVAVPTVGVCVGEGGSGGALALAWTDTLLIQEHAVFSVIGPEGAAMILERDAARAPVVADQLRLTSGDLRALGIVDAVVPDDIDATVAAIAAALTSAEIGRRRARPDAVSAAALRP